MTPSEPRRWRRWFGHHPFRTCLRVLAALLGAGVTGWLLSTLWPEPDRVARGAPPSLSDPTSLALFPDAAVTVLLIGVDADNLKDPTNNAAPAGRANADALLLVRIDAGQSLQVLQLPTELAVQLPGSDTTMALGGVWRTGGAALTADAVGEILGSAEGRPQRYVVLPRKVLRDVVDGLGEVDVILSQSYKRTDRTMKYSMDLQAGRQSLNGAQAEQLVRFRKDAKDDINRRVRQQVLMRAVVDQLQAPGGIVLIPGLLDQVGGQVDTNLSTGEMLSLAAAVLASPPPLRFTQLPLEPRAGEQTLRQLKNDLKLPLWPPAP